MKQRGASNSNKRVSNGLVAMSSAAVLAVYTAGYVRTRPSTARLAEQVYERSIERDTPPVEGRHTASVQPPTGHVATPSAAPLAHSDPQRPARVSAPHAASVQRSAAAETGESAPAPVESPASTAALASPATSSTTTSAPAASEASTPAVAESKVEAPPAAAPVWKDGKYTAWGTCRHGDIQATVVIEGGRILSAEITNCQTRYACDVIESLPGKVITRQRNKFDAVGGATESAYAYYGAVYWALDQASK